MKTRRSAIALVAGTVLAILSASGTNAVAAHLLALPDEVDLIDVDAPMLAAAVDDDDAPRPERPEASGPRMSKDAYIDGILERNIFDHRAIGQEAEGEAGEEGESDLEVRLIGTLVAVPAEFSSALIARDTQNAVAHTYGVGDRVLDAEIVEIMRRAIRVRRSDGRVERIEVERPDDDDKGKRPARPSGSDDEEITKVGDDEYLVSRSLVDQYLSDPTKAARLGRARPHRSNGEVDGYRLYRIRRNSAGFKLGIRNGDVVHSVNGHDLTSMSEAMNAYQALRNEGKFTIEVTRRGQRKTLSYELR